VSKHLKVLEDAGLVTRGRTAQRRPARLAPAALGEVAEWLEKYRPLWEDSFGALGARLGTND
jgi:DNA-binding transcriptional ArsR family regulator